MGGYHVVPPNGHVRQRKKNKTFYSQWSWSCVHVDLTSMATIDLHWVGLFPPLKSRMVMWIRTFWVNDPFKVGSLLLNPSLVSTSSRIMFIGRSHHSDRSSLWTPSARQSSSWRRSASSSCSRRVGGAAKSVQSGNKSKD